MSRDALPDQIVCVFLTLFKPVGGGQTHFQKFMLQILYNSWGFLAYEIDINGPSD